MDLSLTKINDKKIGIPYLTGASCFENEKICFTRWTDVPTNISNIGDILITVKGTVGKMAFNTYGDIHIARQIMSIKVDDLINSEYIYYAINSKIEEISSKSAGLIPGITRETILSLVINIPPKKEQDKIVSLLKTLIPKISNIIKEYNDISNLSSIIKMKILDYYFCENSSYKSYYTNRKKASISNLVPKDKIGDGDWVLSENMDKNGEYSLVQLKHIGAGKYLNKPFSHVNNEFFILNNCTEIKENYILINRLIADKMDVCLLPHFNFKCITAVDVCWIAPSEQYNQKYLLYYLLSPIFQKQVLLKTSGTTRKRISKKNLIHLELNIHDRKYQEAIASEIESMFDILDSLSS